MTGDCADIEAPPRVDRYVEYARFWREVCAGALLSYGMPAGDECAGPDGARCVGGVGDVDP